MLLIKKPFAQFVLASCLSMVSLCSFAEASDLKLGLTDTLNDHRQACKAYYDGGMQALHALNFDLAFENFINGAWGGNRKCATEVGKLLISDKEFNWNPSVIPTNKHVKETFDAKEQPKCTQPQIKKAFEILKVTEVNTELVNEIQGYIKNINSSDWPELHFVMFKISSAVNQDNWWETENGALQYKQALDPLLKRNTQGSLSDCQADILSKLVKYKIKYAPSTEEAIRILKTLEPKNLKNIYKSLAILSEFCQPAEACHYWRLAAYRGSKVSQYSLISSLLESTNQSLEGIYWLHRYAESSQKGLEWLVASYSQGVKMIHVDRDPTEWFINPQPEHAKAVLAFAARNGNPLAAYHIALRDKNFEQAWNILKTVNAVKKRVNFELARAYEYGLPNALEVNYEKSAEHYYQAIELGFSSQSILPHLHSLAQNGSRKAQTYLDQLNQ